MITEKEEVLSPRMRLLIADMCAEWQALDRRIRAFDEEFATLVRCDDASRRLTTIPGIGVLNASALTAATGTGKPFDEGEI